MKTKVVAKLWRDDGIWEFMPFEDERTQALLTSDSPPSSWPVVELDQILMDRYNAVLTKLTGISAEVQKAVDAYQAEDRLRHTKDK